MSQTWNKNNTFAKVFLMLIDVMLLIRNNGFNILTLVVMHAEVVKLNNMIVFAIK